MIHPGTYLSIPSNASIDPSFSSRRWLVSALFGLAYYFDLAKWFLVDLEEARIIYTIRFLAIQSI